MSIPNTTPEPAPATATNAVAKTDAKVKKEPKTPPAPTAKARAKAQAPEKAPKAARPTPTPQDHPENPTAAKSGGQTLPGVRPTRTRLYLAGTIIAKYGLTAGVTPEMVAELDAVYGEANPVESFGRLRNAWHVVRGYKGLVGDAIE